MGLWLVVSLTLGAGAAEDVEALQRELVQPYDDENDVVATMGPRSLTREGLRDAVRADPHSFELLDRSVTRLTTGRRLGWVGVGSMALGAGVFAIAMAVAGAAGVVTPVALGLFVAAGVLAVGALALAMTNLVLSIQGQEDFVSGVIAWNRFVFARSSAAGSPFVRAVEEQWLGLCEKDGLALCVGTRGLGSNDELAELLRSRSVENAERLQQGLKDVTSGLVLAIAGFSLEVAAIPFMLFLAPPLNLALAIPALAVGLGLVLGGSYLLREGGREVQRAIAAHNFSVVNDALKAARATDGPAPAVQPPTETPPPTPPDVPAPPSEPPTPPPAPPPTGPTRQPLRPRTVLDGPLPALVLATF